MSRLSRRAKIIVSTRPAIRRASRRVLASPACRAAVQRAFSSENFALHSHLILPAWMLAQQTTASWAIGHHEGASGRGCWRQWAFFKNFLNHLGRRLTRRQTACPTRPARHRAAAVLDCVIVRADIICQKSFSRMQRCQRTIRPGGPRSRSFFRRHHHLFRFFGVILALPSPRLLGVGLYWFLMDGGFGWLYRSGVATVINCRIGRARVVAAAMWMWWKNHFSFGAYFGNTFLAEARRTRCS